MTFGRDMKFFLTIFAILTSAFASVAETPKELTHSEVLMFVAQAKQIKVCKVRLGQGGLVSGITSGPSVTVSDKDTDILRHILVSYNSYETGGHRCGFSPGYKITVIESEDTMDIFLCYGCHDYIASKGLLFSPERSFAPSAQAIKDILDRQNLKEP